MRDEVIGAQGNGAHELLVKRLHGARAQNRVRRREIDQVIIVDDQRTETQFLAPGAEARGFGLRDAIASAFPHARTARKNLQCVGAEAVRDFERGGYVAGDGSVDANADAAVFPRGNFRGRRSFRAVLVGGVEG
jgi:hypothetical protein